LGLDPV